jgi:apolipoprotein N-acyltransferase
MGFDPPAYMAVPIFGILISAMLCLVLLNWPAGLCKHRHRWLRAFERFCAMAALCLALGAVLFVPSRDAPNTAGPLGNTLVHTGERMAR